MPLALAFATISILREKLDSSVDYSIYSQDTIYDSERHTTTTFSQFKCLSQKDVKSLITQSPSKSCTSDPIPTGLLKQCLDELLPTITSLVNESLNTGVFPSQYKIASVTPILKKPNLDLIFKNYRPVSNLEFLSKLMERAAADQLNDYLSSNNLLEVMQSGYRQFHSTETALLKVFDDIMFAVDKQHCVFIVLLDLSAAFDTVDHSILLGRLKSSFGIAGTALEWLKSYLSDRYQYVTINGARSEKTKLRWGVPQGSVLGPILFIMYTTPLGQIARKHGLEISLYADDSGLYIKFKAGSHASEASTLLKVIKCIAEIKAWMNANKLSFNETKTEFMICGLRQQLTKVITTSITIGDAVIPVVEKAKSLGFILDSSLTLKDHISKLTSSAFFHLKNIKQIRKYLNNDATETLVHAFISSKLDYCNSLFLGLPDVQMNRLQSVQNAAARVVTRSPKYCHITPLLVKLHWLPVSYRVQFKVLLTVYKAIHNQAPKYISSLLEEKQSTRSMRSNGTLHVPRTRLVCTGKRSFSAAAPALWNDLPLSIKSAHNVEDFKKLLKTHLFVKAFM